MKFNHSYPSFSAYERITTTPRTISYITDKLISDFGYNVGDTYMVGGKKGEGLEALWYTL